MPTSTPESIETFSTQFGAYAYAIAGQSIYLASPTGLIRLDPMTGTATVLDEDPGAYLSGVDRELWRAVYATSAVYRYNAVTGERDLQLEVSKPGGLYATDTTVFVTEHELGGIVLIDADTGRQIGRTVLAPPSDCCAGLGVAAADDAIWTGIGWAKKFFKLSPDEGSILDEIDLSHHPAPILRFAAGAVWVRAATDYEDDQPEAGLMFKVDAATSAVTEMVVDESAWNAAEIDGQLWFPAGGQLIQVDPSTGQTLRAIVLGVPGFEATDLFEAYGSIWVTASEEPLVLRLAKDDFR